MITWVNHLGEVRSIQNGSVIKNETAKAFSFNEVSGVSDLREIWSTKYTYPTKGITTLIMNPNNIFSIREEICEDTDDVSKLSDFTDTIFKNK